MRYPLPERRGPEGIEPVRLFDTAVVLSVATATLLVPPTRLPAVVDLLDYLSHRSILAGIGTPELGIERIAESVALCKGWVLSQHSEFGALAIRPEGDHGAWLSEQVERLGPNLPLRPMPIAMVGWMGPKGIYG